MFIHSAEAFSGGGDGGLGEHDRDVVGACWPAILKAASAAFAARVREVEGY